MLLVTCWGAGAVERSSFRYRINSEQMDSTYRDNAAALASLDVLMASGREVAYVLVQGVASPDGPQAVNRRIARARANNMVAQLSVRYPSLGADRFRVVVLDEDWSGIIGYLSRSSHPWKEDAIAILRSPETDRKTRLQDLWVGEAWDDLVKHWFPRLRRTEVQVVFASAEAELPTSTDRVVFARSSATLQEDYRNNAAVLAGVHPSDTVYLNAWSSVEGTESVNHSLSVRRAAAVRDRLVSAGIPESHIFTRVLGEDWEGLRNLVLHDYDGADKNDILWILDNASLSISAKKNALRQLNGGNTWRTLVTHTMTDLRAVVLSYKGKASAAFPPAASENTAVSEKPDSSAEPSAEPSADSVAEPSIEPSAASLSEPSADATSEESSSEPSAEPVPDTIPVASDVSDEPSSDADQSTEVAAAPETVQLEEPVRIEKSNGDDRTAGEFENLKPVPAATVVPLFVKEPRALFGVSTNLLYDAVTAVNVGLEVPVGHHSVLRADYLFPWWVAADNSRAFQIQHLDLGYRYYLKAWEKRDASVLRGWYLSAAFGTGKFDIEPNKKGVQGKEFMGSLGVGYTLPLGNWWRLDMNIGLGGMYADFQHYQWQEDQQLHFLNQDHFLWPGPTSAKVSLIYLFHYNKKITK